MTFKKIVVSILFATTLVGCPATIKIELKNESENSIKVVYSTGFESEIVSGATKEEIYKLGCIKIKSGGKLYEYKSIIPPDNFFSTNSYESLLQAVFTNNGELILYTKDKSESINLILGC